MVGASFTITVAFIAVPTQLPCVGVIVKVTNTGALVVLVNVPLISPVPLAAIPVAATRLFLTQLYTVPATGLPFNTMVVIGEPEHTVCEEGVAVTLGLPDTFSTTEPALY